MTALVALVGCSSSGSNNGGASSAARGGTGSAPPAFGVEGVPSGLSGTRVRVYDTNGLTSLHSLYDDFKTGTGATIVTDYNATGTKLLAAAQAGTSQWDLAILVPGDFLAAKKAGYLQKLDKSIVPFDKVAPSAQDDYGITGMTFGSVMTWNTNKFPASGPQPSSAADFFDLNRFPGRRCMYEYPEYGATLEIALEADGVPSPDLYPLDVNRALKKLDTIKNDIVWWTTGQQAIQNLTNGTCSVGISWTGRVLNAVVEQKSPLAMTWSGGTISTGTWVVLKGAKNPVGANAFISYDIQDLDAQKKFVNATGYTTDINALPLSSYDKQIQPYVALGDNAKSAVTEDAAYYGDRIASLVKTFNNWVGA